jgi:hypothetical protein
VIYRDEQLNTCTLTRFIKRYMNICNTKSNSNRALTWVLILFMRAQRPKLYSNRAPPRALKLERGLKSPSHLSFLGGPRPSPQIIVSSCFPCFLFPHWCAACFPIRAPPRFRLPSLKGPKWLDEGE